MTSRKNINAKVVHFELNDLLDRIEGGEFDRKFAIVLLSVNSKWEINDAYCCIDFVRARRLNVASLDLAMVYRRSATATMIAPKSMQPSYLDLKFYHDQYATIGCIKAKAKVSNN